MYIDHFRSMAPSRRVGPVTDGPHVFAFRVCNVAGGIIYWDMNSGMIMGSYDDKKVKKHITAN